MKTKSIIICFFFLTITVNSQSLNKKNNESITVAIYKMDIYPDNQNIEKVQNPANIQQKLDEFRKTLESIEYGLYMSKTKSLYKSVEKIESNEGQNITLFKIMGGDVRYCNIETKQRFNQTETMGEKINIILPYNEYLWTITTETKKINGYTCYKATSHKEEFSKARNKIISFDPVVWFTPEIPSPFGPSGLDGLPGLVLEGTINGKKYFYATKIIFDYQGKKINFEISKDGKFVTEAEYEDIQIKIMNQQ